MDSENEELTHKDYAHLSFDELQQLTPEDREEMRNGSLKKIHKLEEKVIDFLNTCEDNGIATTQ